MSEKLRAHTPYHNCDGKRVKNVTGITGNIGWNTYPLMYWGNNLGLEGLDCKEVMREAANIGTIGHKMIQNHFTGERLDRTKYIPEEVEKAENVYNSFLEWEKDHKHLTITICELKTVSETHQYGGTLDAVAEGPENDLYLLDWKSSKGIYPVYGCQAMAYKKAIEEQEDLEITHCWIVHLEKERIGYDIWKMDPQEQEAGWECFQAAQVLAEKHKILNRKRA